MRSNKRFLSRLSILILPVLALVGACVDAPRGARQQGARPQPEVIASSREARQCLSELQGMQARFTPLPDKYFAPGCTTLNSVRIDSLRSDTANLTLANLGPVTCPIATTFAGWARYGVDRAAREILGSPLARIETFGSYNCRNVAGTSRRSGHSTADAIDVSGFTLSDGRRISIVNDWNSPNPDVRRFLRTVHGSACKRFGTVLGPEYNAAHRDHFHLEGTHGNFCR